MDPVSVLTCLTMFLAVISANKIPQETTGKQQQQSIDLYQPPITEQKTPNVEQNVEEDQQLSDKELLQQTLAQNSEMIKLLNSYERFFGTLYAESPESFDPTVAVDTRMSRLNSYLGNREAELLSLRPQPPVKVQNDTIDAELLGTVLYELDEQKNNMDKKMRHLEEKVGRIASSIPGHANGQFNTNEDSIDVPVDDSSNSQQTTNRNKNCRSKRELSDNETQTTIDQLEQRIDRVEDLIISHIFPIINGTVSAWSKIAAGYDLSSTDSTSEQFTNGSKISLLKVLEEEIQKLRNSQLETKQVAFSAARTTPFMGETTAQALHFDHIFVNKGHHFMEENSTFLCEITGYYFISFTVRSFDGYVLGIVLMKNEDYVTSIFTDAHDRNVMESQSVIIHMRKGDKLWLRHPPSERFAIHSDRYKYTTFSGFLIYKGE